MTRSCISQDPISINTYDTDIHEVTEWYTHNKLTLNASKTQILLLGPQKAKAPEQLKFSEENIYPRYLPIQFG